MKNNVLAMGLVMLYFGLLIPLSLATGQPTDRLLNSPAISTDAVYSLSSTGAATFTFYLPIIARAPELYGYVTENGQPAQDIAVDLWAFHDSPFTQVWMGTVQTDATGSYNFTVPPIYSCVPAPYQLCWYFYLNYTDYSAPPGRLIFSETGPITNYILGTTRQFPTFDIGAPILLSPAPDDVVSPTVTFTWIPRPLPEDNYGLEIWDPNNPSTGPLVSIGNLGYTSAYTATLLGNNCSGPCSSLYNKPLSWRLSISAVNGSMSSTGPFTITAPSQ